MEEPLKTPPPVMTPNSLGEMGTHMSYLRRDVDGVLTVLKEVNVKLDVMKDSFITRAEFVDHKKDWEKFCEKLAMKEDVEFLKKIIFGACGFVLLGALGQVLFLIYK